MNESIKREIGQALNAKGVNKPCPLCGNSGFTLLDGFINNTIQDNLSSGLVIGGPSVPTIVLVCNNCGFLSQHALGALNLLEKVQQGGQ
ncbi:MAG: hypothetical protein AB7V50_09520 [Vampirovibrionia bacterium]